MQANEELCSCAFMHSCYVCPMPAKVMHPDCWSFNWKVRDIWHQCRTKMACSNYTSLAMLKNTTCYVSTLQLSGDRRLGFTMYQNCVNQVVQISAYPSNQEKFIASSNFLNLNTIFILVDILITRGHDNTKSVEYYTTYRINLEGVWSLGAHILVDTRYTPSLKTFASTQVHVRKFWSLLAYWITVAVTGPWREL